MKPKQFNVLVTLSSLSGYEESLRKLSRFPGVQFIATSGTAKKLEELGIPAKKVSEVFGPEVFGHAVRGVKVKTLQTPLLASINTKHDNPEQVAYLEGKGFPLIHMVVSEPYGFQDEQSWVNIDLGLIVLLAAAKNVKWVIPVCSHGDLGGVVKLLSTGDGEVGEQKRLSLAVQALRKVTRHFKMVSTWIEGIKVSESDDTDPFTL